VSEAGQALLLLVILLGSSGMGLLLRPFLSERLRDREAIEVVQLVITMLVTFAALVLSLMTTSAKASFDTVGNDLRGFASQIIQLGRMMDEYGPETAPIRQMMREYTASVIATTWPEEKPPSGDYYYRILPSDQIESPILGHLLEQVEVKIRELRPADPVQARLVTDMLNQFDRVLTRRWKLIEEAHPSISTPFLIVLDFWLAIVFLSFGLSGPRNPVSGAITFLGAVSIASAMFIILELDTPFAGFLTVTSQPMREALAHLSAL
jgi:hypothetical protein